MQLQQQEKEWEGKKNSAEPRGTLEKYQKKSDISIIGPQERDEKEYGVQINT